MQSMDSAQQKVGLEDAARRDLATRIAKARLHNILPIDWDEELDDDEREEQIAKATEWLEGIEGAGFAVVPASADDTARQHDQARAVLAQSADLLAATGINLDFCTEAPGCTPDGPMCVPCAFNMISEMVGPEGEALAIMTRLANVAVSIAITDPDQVVSWLRRQAAAVADPDGLRDGLPTPAELLQAAELLQIPIPIDEVGLDSMTDDRQVTTLLGILTAYLITYAHLHDAFADRLTSDQMHMLIASSVNEATGGEATAAMDHADRHLNWAGLIIAEIGRSNRDSPANPAPAIESLIRAAVALITDWRDAHQGPGFTIDDTAYSIGTLNHIQTAREQAEFALKAIQKMIGPRPPHER